MDEGQEIDEDVSENEDDMEIEEGVDKKRQVYLPGKDLAEGEELVCDESAYLILRNVQTGKSNLNVL